MFAHTIVEAPNHGRQQPRGGDLGAERRGADDGGEDLDAAPGTRQDTTRPGARATGVSAPPTGPSASGSSFPGRCDDRHELAALDREVLWHPFTQQQGWAGRGLPDHRPRRRHDAVRHRRQRLHRRRLVAVVQRPRPPPPGDRRRHQGPARPRRAHDDARALARPGGRAGRSASSTSRPTGLSRVFFSDNGSTACEIALKMAYQFGTSAASGGARVRLPAQQLPRRHDRLGLRRRHRPLPLALPPAALRRLAGRARRRRRACARCWPSTATSSRRSSSSRSCRARPGILVHPEGYLRAVRELCDEFGALPHLRRGRDRLRAHGHDVRLRAGGRRRPTSCASPRASRAATCRSPRR